MKLMNVLFGLMLQTISFGQQVMPVLLKNVSGSGPFYPTMSYTNMSTDSGFKGIPAELVAFKIKELRFESDNEELSILYALTKSNKRLVIFDSNFDRDFTGEKKYLFDYDIRYNNKKEESVVDTTSATEIKFSNAPSIFVKPDIYNCCVNYQNRVDSMWHLFVQTDYHKEGSFQLYNQKFKVAIKGDNSPYFLMDDPPLYLQSNETPFKKQGKNNPSYHINQTIFIGDRAFLIDSVNRVGDTAWVLYKGNTEKQIGTREGLIAENIQASTLDKKAFDLKQLKGKYVLLDFWGTWCKPCLEVIPRLKSLNEKYKSKGLALVSIAYDNKESHQKLLQIIKEKQMDWTQIYDDRDSQHNICDQYYITNFPTSILVNPDGKIIFRSYGEPDFTRLEKLVNDNIR